MGGQKWPDYCKSDKGNHGYKVIDSKFITGNVFAKGSGNVMGKRSKRLWASTHGKPQCRKQSNSKDCNCV